MGMPKITPALKTNLSKEMQKTYDDYLRIGVRTAVIEQADRDAKELVQQLTVANQAENYLKVVKLLHPQTNTD
jgi:hypothetical protein